MPLTRIDAYEVFYSANSFSPRIGLKHAGEFIGQLIFKPNGATLPADTSENGQVKLHYHLDDFHNAIDLLRNEKPVYLYYNGSGRVSRMGSRRWLRRLVKVRWWRPAPERQKPSFPRRAELPSAGQPRRASEPSYRRHANRLESASQSVRKSRTAPCELQFGCSTAASASFWPADRLACRQRSACLPQSARLTCRRSSACAIAWVPTKLGLSESQLPAIAHLSRAASRLTPSRIARSLSPENPRMNSLRGARVR